MAADSEAFSLITPPNFGVGTGNGASPTVVVAMGEPSVPVTSSAAAIHENWPQASADAAMAPRSRSGSFDLSKIWLASSRGRARRLLGPPA